MFGRTSQARLIGLVVATALVSGGSAGAVQKTPDKNSVELVVRGCLKGRDLAGTEISGDASLPDHTDATFRVSAKGELNDAVKKLNGNLVEVTGRVKKVALAEPGLKIRGIVIGGSPMDRDPTRNPARNPQSRIIPIDVTAIELISKSCPTLKG